MKNSHLFSDYMVASSVNRSIRSINQSPTSGTVHKQRSSYGPRLTLLSRSNDPSPTKQQAKEEGHEYIEKILLLSLEISRLNNLNEALRNNNNNSHRESISQQEVIMRSSKVSNNNKQITLLKESNQTLKIAIKTLESSLMKGEQEKTKLKVSYQSRINELQLQINNYTWKLTQNEKQLERMRKQKYEIQMEVQKSIIEKSRQESIATRSMQKSIEAEKNHEIGLLRETIAKLQSQVNEQKFTIRFMNEENEKLANKEAELLMANQQFANEFEQIKRRTDYELTTTSINTSLEMNDMEKYDSMSVDYRTLRQDIANLQHQLQQRLQELHERQSIITQLKQNNLDFRTKCEELSHQSNEKDFWQHKKMIALEEECKLLIGRKQGEVRQKSQEVRQKDMQITRLEGQLEGLRQEVERLVLENDLLRKMVGEQRQTIELKTLEQSAKNLQLSDKLRKTERKLKNAERQSSTTRKDVENIYLLNGNNSNGYNANNIYNSPDTRLFKSRSIESTSFFTNRRGIDISLESIVTTTVALQGSNERSMRLIDKSQQKLLSSMSPIRSKRKVLLEKNGLGSSRKGSVISGGSGEKRGTRLRCEKRERRHERTVRKDQENNERRSNGNRDGMRSSIREYYGEDNA